jgi:hypothetical protein
MDSSTPKRKAFPIRHEVALHLFTTGQIVRLKDRLSLQSQTAATYRITAILPPEEIRCNIASGTTMKFTNGWQCRPVLNRCAYHLRGVAALSFKRPSAN